MRLTRIKPAAAPSRVSKWATPADPDLQRADTVNEVSMGGPRSIGSGSNGASCPPRSEAE